MKDGEISVAFPKDAALHRDTVLRGGRPLVEKALTEFFGRPTRLVEETSEAALSAAPLSIAEQALRGREAREKEVEAKIRQHPAVRAALKVLGGEIEHVQVLEPQERPVEEQVDGE